MLTIREASINSWYLSTRILINYILALYIYVYIFIIFSMSHSFQRAEGLRVQEKGCVYIILRILLILPKYYPTYLSPGTL